ncbi:MAG: DUF2147 domain-containing protein [Asticcacaulis sp.]
MPNVKTSLAIIAALLIAVPAYAATEKSTDTSPFEGYWARGDGKARVRLAPCGSDLCAVNTWIRPDVRDEKVGDRLVMTVKPDGEGKLSGTAYDPQRHMKYRMLITLSGGGDAMTTNGCVLGGLLCKRMGWTRLAAPPQTDRP